MDVKPFTPVRRRRFIVAGAALSGVGALLFVVGFAGFVLAGRERVSSFGESGSDPVAWWLLCALALPFLFAGGVLLRIGLVRPVAEFLAAETAGAVEHSSAAWGRGAGRGLGESGVPVGGQVVKVKCRSCGFLESEDARFCSRCSKPV